MTVLELKIVPDKSAGGSRFARKFAFGLTKCSGQGTEGTFQMTEQIVCCPYCMLGDQRGPMLKRPEWFICEQCGHTVIPEDPDFKCSCRNCPKVKRAA